MFFDGSFAAAYAIEAWMKPTPMRVTIVDDMMTEAVVGLVIPTLEGDHHASVGDWIIRGVKGEFYPCKPDIFAATYEPANTPPTTASTSPANPRR